MDFYPIMDFECDITSMRGLEPTWGLKHENLRVRKPIGQWVNYYNNEINYWLGDNLSIFFILSL